MSTKNTLLALLVLLFIGVVGGLFIFLPKGTRPDTAAVGAIHTTPSGVPRAAYMLASSTLEVTHTVSNGVHIYAGSIPLSSDCEVLSSAITATGSNPVSVTLAITLLKPDVGCVSTSTTTVPTDFSASITRKDPKEKIVFGGITVNGENADFSIKESN